MADTAMKHIALNFAKHDKFERVDFRRWKKKMHFLLSNMSMVYVLTTPIPEWGECYYGTNQEEDYKDFKHTLKHQKEELTLDELGSHMCIEESLMVYNDKKDKRKHQDTKADPKKKSKVTCWKCGKTRHLKKDCKGGKVCNKANGLTNGSTSTNSLK
nr:zinc finger, CCHC-type [Tanacetum cinerariifolium]